MKFCLIGGAGYIAPRHVKAIRDLGHELTWIVDPASNVGYVGNLFPEARYATKIEHTNPVDYDYVSITSPNYLHYLHILQALELSKKVICEKPLVLDPNHCRALIGKPVSTILQLRQHPGVEQLRQNPPDKVHVNYYSARGNWYRGTWKNIPILSGGLLMNIFIHALDCLYYIFGQQEFRVQEYTPDRASGTYGPHTWVTSIEPHLTPTRSLSFGRESLNLSDNFQNAHTEAYRRVLAGTAPGPVDILPTLEMLAKYM